MQIQVQKAPQLCALHPTRLRSRHLGAHASATASEPNIRTIWETPNAHDSYDEVQQGEDGAKVAVNPPQWALKPRNRHFEPVTAERMLSQREWNYIALHDEVCITCCKSCRPVQCHACMRAATQHSQADSTLQLPSQHAAQLQAQTYTSLVCHALWKRRTPHAPLIPVPSPCRSLLFKSPAASGMRGAWATATSRAPSAKLSKLMQSSPCASRDWR